jgi:hypothetical protein
MPTRVSYQALVEFTRSLSHADLRVCGYRLRSGFDDIARVLNAVLDGRSLCAKTSDHVHCGQNSTTVCGLLRVLSVVAHVFLLS